MLKEISNLVSKPDNKANKPKEETRDDRKTTMAKNLALKLGAAKNKREN